MLVQSMLMLHVNWSPFTHGLEQVIEWTVVVLWNFSAFSSNAVLPSVVRGQPGISMASMWRALSAYSSLIASVPFPEPHSSERRLATFMVA